MVSETTLFFIAQTTDFSILGYYDFITHPP